MTIKEVYNTVRKDPATNWFCFGKRIETNNGVKNDFRLEKGDKNHCEEFFYKFNKNTDEGYNFMREFDIDDPTGYRTVGAWSQDPLEQEQGDNERAYSYALDCMNRLFQWYQLEDRVEWGFLL